MATDHPTDHWRVRPEGAAGEGRAVALLQLAQEIADGAWQDTDQVRDPTTGRWVTVGNHPQLEEFLPTTPRLRRRPDDDPEMDITPMIDVTFQLIIFFMITATFVVQKTMDMPRAEAAEESSRWQPSWNDVETQYIVVEIKSDGSITVDDEPAKLADLPAVLREAASQREIVEMALTVHDDVPHHLVVGVLDAAAGAEVEKVHFARGRALADGSPAAEAPQSSPATASP